ncbi:MAG TPA: adenylate/guanylate cyclase domain-containing protein [Acidimicrobiia bacterium]|nr:adenylate/guanylate cyclase domain-containing protein [Acidimicrobiia bacterium]
MAGTVGRPDTRFAETPRGFVGYQVFGVEGPDIVFITNWMTNVDLYWDELSAVRYLDRLGAIGRVFLIDKRGSGVSDHSSRGYIDPVEDSVDDISAVLDANGSEEAVLIGDTEGGMLACILAATFPQRFPSLVLVNSYARMLRADDYPIGAPQEVVDAMSATWKATFGRSPETLYYTAPSAARDPRFLAWYPWFQRQAMPPSVARKAVEWIAETDIRSVLPAIQAETLVVHRRDARFHRLQFGEYLAEHIDGARLEIVEGEDTLPFHAGDTSDILDHIESFVTGDRARVHTNRKLATVLFSDIVGSTNLASDVGDDRWLDFRAEHNRIVRRNLERFNGTEITTTGDGFLATFDGPMRAIQCAQVMVSEVKKIGLDIRVGIHTGEIELREGEIGGLAVHVAARVMDAAESGGIMASSTVKDLVLGSNVAFTQCGTFDLKGVPGSWNLYEIETAGVSGGA